MVMCSCLFSLTFTSALFSWCGDLKSHGFLSLTLAQAVNNFSALKYPKRFGLLPFSLAGPVWKD